MAVAIRGSCYRKITEINLLIFDSKNYEAGKHYWQGGKLQYG